MTFVPDRPSTRVPRTEPLKRLLAERHIALKKRWGQHFCLDPNLLDFIVRLAQPSTLDVALEIGCGLGHLTRVLAPRVRKLVGSEIDRGLAAILRERIAGLENFELVEGDVLDGQEDLSPAVQEAVRRALKEAEGGRFLVVANLPYAVAATVVVALLESPLPIAGMVLMMQKEVAERMGSAPGDMAYGLTSVLVQAKAGVHLRRRVPPEVFWPRPRVASEIVLITPRPDAMGGEDYRKVKALAKLLFQHRRKTLGACLRLLGLELRGGLAPGLRVDELGLPEISRLAGI